MISARCRRSRKQRRCGCGKRIEKGDRYLEQVASPHHDDLGNPHWWRLAECEDCARRYGRGGHFDQEATFDAR